MTAFFVILAILGSAAAVLLPLFRSGTCTAFFPEDRPSELRKSLREERDSLLSALRDVDFDFETGKLSAEDHASLKGRQQALADDVAGKLEELEILWKEVQEKAARELGERGALPAGVFCPSCGRPMAAQDRFCGSCGRSREERADA